MITSGQNKAAKVKVNAGERSEMQIADVAKVFDMLSTGLYSNVPQSIAREIAANARDAHADKGNLDQPWDITFPTSFNPVFRIRDYGVGLTHKQVMGLYTNLGESTKETSNTGVGKFGIGSKAPFAYIDSFSVIAIMDGLKTFYSVVKEPVYKVMDEESSNDELVTFVRCDSAGLSEDGRQFNADDVVPAGMIPAVHVMGQEDTTEDTGVEVTFPIESGDIEKFRTAIQRVMFGHEVKPNVVDATGVPDAHFEGWKELPTISEGRGWKLLGENLEGYRGKAYAKMGCVLYPIDVESIDGLDYGQQHLLNHSMIIEFPLGSLDITPSRESLKYGRLSPTSPAIVKRLKGIIEDMVKETLAVYDNCDTYWEACQAYRDHLRKNLPHVVRDAVRDKARWNGAELEDIISWNRPEGVGTRLTGTVLCGSKLSNRVLRHTSEANLHITPTPKTIFAFEDLSAQGKTTKRVAARIRHFADANKSDIDTIVWFKYRGGKEASEEVSRILDWADGATILDVADLPEPPKNSITGPRRPVQVRRLRYSSFDGRVDLTPEDFEAGGYYIPLERGVPRVPNGYASPSDMFSVLKSCGEIPVGADVYGAPKSLWKHFEGTQWISLYELADATFAKQFDEEAVKRSRAISLVVKNSFFRFLTEKLDTKKFGAKSTIKKALEFQHTVESMPKPAVDIMIQLARAVNRDADTHPVNHELVLKSADFEDATDAEYPLLRAISTHCRYADEVLDKLTEYVHTCDIANAATNQAANAA